MSEVYRFWLWVSWIVPAALALLVFLPKITGKRHGSYGDHHGGADKTPGIIEGGKKD